VIQGRFVLISERSTKNTLTTEPKIVPGVVSSQCIKKMIATHDCDWHNLAVECFESFVDKRTSSRARLMNTKNWYGPLRRMVCVFCFTAALSNLATAAPPLELIHDANAVEIDRLVANRNSQIATLFQQTSASSPDHVFYYDGVATDHIVPGKRYVSIELSNWGVAIKDFGGLGSAVATAPFGAVPQEVFRSGPNGSLSEVDINDQGTVAFFARETNSHGLRDVYRLVAGGTPTLLPELGENSLYDPALVDEQGRVLARHEFTTPTFRSDFYRYSQATGWSNLTTGKLPASTEVASNLDLVGPRPMAANGDFVFAGRRALPSGKHRWEVLLYDDSQNTVTSVMDYSSQVVDFFGEPYGLGVSATMSDDGDLWIFARRTQSGYPTELKTLYRNADGTVVDIPTLLPAGLSLVDHEQFHSLSYAGDLWLSAVDSVSGRYSYFLFSNNTLTPVLSDVSQLLVMPVLTNSMDVYAWIYDGAASDIYRVASVPEPSAGFLLFTAVLLFALRKLRVVDASTGTTAIQANN
jgi:hypothetical protein